MANNPPPTLPPPACPLPHPGLQASPPQPGQLSSCAGPSTATGTLQHPAPDIPPPAPKQSPPTKPPLSILSRRPLTRASASRIGDRLRRQFDAQMDQFQSKTQTMIGNIQKRPSNNQHILSQFTNLDNNLGNNQHRATHRTHPSRSLSNQPPPPLPDS